MTETEKDLSRMAIRHTMSIYNNCGDRGQIPELLTAFAPDGALEVPGAVYKGHDAILAYLSGVKDNGSEITDLQSSDGNNLRGSRHHLTTSRIEFDSPTDAQGWTYFFVSRQGQILQEGLYVDRFAKIEDRWFITYRRVKMLWILGH